MVNGFGHFLAASLVVLAPAAGHAASRTPTPPPETTRPDAGHHPPANLRPDTGHAPPAKTRPDTGHFPPAKTRPDTGHFPPAKTRPDTGHFPPAKTRPDTGHVPPAKQLPPPRVKVSLMCTTERLDGAKIRLPAGDSRLEAPILCVLAAGPRTANAGLTGTLRTSVVRKIRATHSGPLAGDDVAKMQQELVSGEDYDTCMPLTIEGEVRSAAGKTLGRKKIVVQQSCPD
jgi:hypothetical protein